jgi:hypothetical protein
LKKQKQRKGRTMKRILLAIAAAVTLLVGTLATPSTADAQRPWRGGYYGGYGPYYGGYYYGYRPYYGRYYAPRAYYGPRYYYGAPRYYGYRYGYPAYRYSARPGVGAGVYVY